MNWKDHIFKPKWQHRDPEVRREAVTAGDDPELLSALEDILQQDEAPEVRRAAVPRITDLAVLLKAAASEQDKQVGKALEQRIASLVASTDADRPPLAQRLDVVRASRDRDLLEAVAEHAPEPELRTAALGRVKRQGFLGDRAIHDPDPDVRQAAAAAITQQSTLQRVIDETRTRDKTLHQALVTRLKTERLAAGDPEAIAAEAQEVCSRLEDLATAHRHEVNEVPADLRRRWAEIEARAPEPFARRWARAEARLTQPPQAPDAQPEPPPSSGTEKPAPEAKPEPKPEPDVPAPLAGLLDELRSLAGSERIPGSERIAKLESRLEALSEQGENAAREALGKARKLLAGLADARARLAEAAAQDLDAARSLLAEYESQVEEGLLQKALESRQKIRSMAGRWKRDPRWKPIEESLSSLHARLRELRDWQHWSNDKIRKELITEMEVLPKADLHPDAMLDRIKTLQKRWKELEQSEQIAGEQHFAAAPWMWRKFRAAGNAAFNAAKPFLEKRSEIQDQHQQEIEARIAALQELAGAEQADWPALGKALKQVRKSFRELDQVPAKARKKLAARLRKVADQAEQRLAAHQDDIEKEKRKLIRAAEQLPYIEDRDEAIQKAKQLQADWKAAGSLWRKREQPLWEAFRAPIDPLFEELQAERDEQREVQKQHREEQQQLCKELKAILSAPEEKLLAAEGKVRGLKERWADIEFPDRRIRADFDRLLGQFESRLQESQKKNVERTRDRWWEKSAILHEWEAAAILGTLDPAAQKKWLERWPQDAADNDTDATLDRRFAQAQEGKHPPGFEPDALERATDLCIQLEFLSGLPSPDQDRERRMKYQVQRLAQSMSGSGQQLSALDEARQAEADWLTLPPLEPADYARLAPRVQAALKEVYGTLNVTKQ